jgi:ribosomal protein S18 acetylase RimI-like enzyme
VRPGRAQDLAAVVGLWEQEVRDARRELVPAEGWLRRSVAGFDWEAGSSVVEAGNGALDGAVLVTYRSYSIGSITRVEPAVAAGSDSDLRLRLVEWGLGLSRAAGAAGAQVWLPGGQGGDLGAVGLQRVRPWWRMDRSLEGELPVPEPVPGYELVVGPGVAPGVWSDVHNRSFAEHWRYSMRTEEELMAWRPPELALLAVTEHHSPAAVTLGQIETYAHDARAQPVGLVGSVGTLPGHRRKGLAGWLVAESLLRLRQLGARSASLYVDGLNATRAPDLYRRLGFEVAFETDVWEATFA